ncbi:unnamed protein product [Aureobasidium mustum]|uniref:Uncharacterized protein n=1 Tax=Aureobasidium mustum TaxID=2773714 RepID=A0A9N8PAB9_9PEZI|nr:unnamed protein product [Aureobasidium mustum]
MDQPETSEQRAVHVTPHDGSIILRQNAYADMRPFIEQLWEDRRSMCCNIYLDQFPRGTNGKGATKEEEDAFLLQYFSEREFLLQGGRFLKQVLYAIAKFNEDSVLTHAEKWWREYNFCASSGMDPIQIRQILDLRQATNFPASFLERVVLLISDGFRRLYGPQDQRSTDVAEPTERNVATTTHRHHYQQQHRHRAVSVHDDVHVRHGTSLLHSQPHSGRPRQSHKQEHYGRNRRPSGNGFPDFDANHGFVNQPYMLAGPPMDGPLSGYYSPPMYAHTAEPRMPPDLLGHAYYPDNILHQSNASFSQRPRQRLVDPHSFERFSEERARENRSFSDVAADDREDAAPTGNNTALPSLSEDSPIDKEYGKQDSSPKTTEDDSFQTAAETPADVPDDAPDDVPDNNPVDAPVDALGDTPVETSLSMALTDQEVGGQKAESFPHSPTTTTESGDTTSVAAIGQQLSTGIHASQVTASKPGPKQTESFSPFARQAKTKKDSKQRSGKSKSKPKSDLVNPKQSKADTPVDTEAHEKDTDVQNPVSASIASPSSDIRREQGENEDVDRSTSATESAEHAELSNLQTQDNDPTKNHTESATPQTRSTLSSVTALLSGALSSMSSNKAKKGDDSSTASLQNEVPATAPKKKKSKKTKKKKKAKTATQAPDGDSSETLANETPVGSPPSNKMYSLRDNTNILDNRLSSLNIREGSIVELHENTIGYRTSLPDQQQENLSSKNNELVEQSRRKTQEMYEQEKLLKTQRKR